jgi:hypothetical protein
MKKLFEQDRIAARTTGCRPDAADGSGAQAGEPNRQHLSESASTIVYVDAAPIIRPSTNPARHLDQLRGRARAVAAARRRRELTMLLVAEWIAQRRAAQKHAQIAREYGLELHAPQPHAQQLHAQQPHAAAALHDPSGDDGFDTASSPEPQRVRRPH